MRVHCNHCRRETNHDLLKTKDYSGVDEEQDFTWRTQFDMLQCSGCEEVTLRRVAEFSEDPDPTVTFYPPRVARWLPKWKYSLPREIKNLMEEIYGALQADSRSLAMMGARAVIESTMLRKTEDTGSFSGNLQQFEELGYVSKQNRHYLETALDAGSAVIHRGHSPTPFELETVMDIAENLLQSVFVLEKPSKALKELTPARPPRKKSSALTIPSNAALLDNSSKTD